MKNKQTEHIVKKIAQLKWQKNEKTKLPKMEWTRHISNMFVVDFSPFQLFALSF